MGVSAAVLGRERRSRLVLQIAGGLAVWLSGILAIALAAAMVGALYREGWQDIVWVFSAASGSGIIEALWSCAILLALALPPAIAVSFFAGVAAAEPSIGGVAGRILNFTLRFGPSVPSVVIGIAALAFVTSSASVEGAVVANPLGAAALALIALNLPIMSARFRFVLWAVPSNWLAAAMAAGASPVDAFFRVVVPRATPGIVGVVLSGGGQMLGETAAVATLLSVSKGVKFVNHSLTFSPAPLSVHLWQRLALGHPDPSGAPAVASEALILLCAIIVLRFVARILLRRRRSAGAIA
jgi:ABC-type phosphate transport system permease subunit